MVLISPLCSSTRLGGGPAPSWAPCWWKIGSAPGQWPRCTEHPAGRDKTAAAGPPGTSPCRRWSGSLERPHRCPTPTAQRCAAEHRGDGQSPGPRRLFRAAEEALPDGGHAGPGPLAQDLRRHGHWPPTQQVHSLPLGQNFQEFLAPPPPKGILGKKNIPTPCNPWGPPGLGPAPPPWPQRQRRDGRSAGGSPHRPQSVRRRPSSPGAPGVPQSPGRPPPSGGKGGPIGPLPHRCRRRRAPVFPDSFCIFVLS